MAQKQTGDSGTANTDQLRARIDQGETGDKVPASDPAVSPLGTDAEAAGNTPTAADARTEMRQSGPAEPPAAPENARGTAERLQPATAILVVGAIGLVGAAALIVAILPHAQ